VHPCAVTCLRHARHGWCAPTPAGLTPLLHLACGASARLHVLACSPDARRLENASRRYLERPAPRAHLRLRQGGPPGACAGACLAPLWRATRALICDPRRSPLCHSPQGLVALGYELVSTGGSASALAAAGVPVKQVEARSLTSRHRLARSFTFLLLTGAHLLSRDAGRPR